MGSRWFFFMVVAIAGLASSVRPGAEGGIPTSIGEGINLVEKSEDGSTRGWQRTALLRGVSDCYYGNSPTDLARCRDKMLDAVGEIAENVEEVAEGDRNDYPSGCGIFEYEVGGIGQTQVFYNKYESDLEDENFRVACYFKLKTQAQRVLNLVNGMRVKKRKNKFCASFMLSTSASKVTTKEYDSTLSEYERAVLEGYKTASDAESEVVEIIGRGENFPQGFRRWLKSNRAVQDIINNEDYTDVGFASITEDGVNYDWVLEFGVPKGRGSTDERYCVEA